MTDDQTNGRQTVASLIAELSAYPPDRLVVFIDPDTGWPASVVVREPYPGEIDKEDAGALVVTGNPYDRQ